MATATATATATAYDDRYSYGYGYSWVVLWPTTAHDDGHGHDMTCFRLHCVLLLIRCMHVYMDMHVSCVYIYA